MKFNKREWCWKHLLFWSKRNVMPSSKSDVSAFNALLQVKNYRVRSLRNISSHQVWENVALKNLNSRQYRHFLAFSSPSGSKIKSHIGQFLLKFTSKSKTPLWGTGGRNQEGWFGETRVWMWRKKSLLLAVVATFGLPGFQCRRKKWKFQKISSGSWELSAVILLEECQLTFSWNMSVINVNEETTILAI